MRRVRATVADVVELERALRQLEELGVVEEVVRAVAQQAHERSNNAWLSPSVDELNQLEDPSAPAVPQPALSPLEQQELCFQKAWLACMWGRAALAGVQPQVSRPEAERCAAALSQPPSLQDFENTRASFQELRLHSIEQLLWRQRYK